MLNNKKLHLSKENRVIAGVAGGLAEYFDTDPVLIRLVFIFFSFVGAGGILVYILLFFYMSRQGGLHKVEDEIKKDIRHPQHHIMGIIGFFLMVIGAMFLLDNIFPEFGIRNFWPVLLIFLGLFIMMHKHRDV